MKIVRTEELKKAYNTMKVHDVAKLFGVSVPTIYRLLDQAGIPRKGMERVMLAGEKGGEG